MTQLQKQKSHAFGKDCYLLGETKDGDYLWLEQAKFNCSWYWGFGYVEQYTNNKNPSYAKDINSHTHYDSLLKEENKDSRGNYKHHINEWKLFNETVLTEKESWELADLMKSAYRLRATADIFHQGGSHIAQTGVDLKDYDFYNAINKIHLPKIFNRIYKLLSPEGEEVDSIERIQAQVA